jgi:hypothetical protein
MKTIKLVLEVICDGTVKTGHVKEAAEKQLRGLGCQNFSMRKGLMPDPDTLVNFSIEWRTARLKQIKNRSNTVLTK